MIQSELRLCPPDQSNIHSLSHLFLVKPLREISAS